MRLFSVAMTIALLMLPSMVSAAGGGSPATVAMVGYSTTASATAPSFERRLFYAENLWWLVYSNGPDMVYTTSGDGRSWNPPRILVKGVMGEIYLGFWQSEDTVYISGSPVSAGLIMPQTRVMRGALDSNGTYGTITLSQMQLINTMHLGQTGSTIASDSSGNVWVAVSTFSSITLLTPPTYIEVYRSTNASGGWQRVHTVEFPTQASAIDNVPLLLPFSSGMALVYGAEVDPSNLSLTFTEDGGATWSQPISTPSSGYFIRDTSEVSQGDTIYFLGGEAERPSIGGPPPSTLWSRLDFWSFTPKSSSFSPAREFNTTGFLTSFSISTSGSALVVGYTSSSSAFTAPSPHQFDIYYAHSNDGGASWTDSAWLTGTISFASHITASISQPVGFAWTENDSSGAYVHFGWVPSSQSWGSNPLLSQPYVLAGAVALAVAVAIFFFVVQRRMGASMQRDSATRQDKPV